MDRKKVAWSQSRVISLSDSRMESTRSSLTYDVFFHKVAHLDSIAESGLQKPSNGIADTYLYLFLSVSSLRTSSR